MTTAKQAGSKKMKMAERARHLKELHFPDIPEAWTWHRSRNDGYTTIPRTLPIAMEVADALSKGKPAGSTLLALWCRAPDHAFLTIENPRLFAAEAGFSGERQVDTWRKRMKHLVEIGFIRAKAGASGDYQHVLLLNPNWAIELRNHYQKDVPHSIYGRFMERVMDIGAFAEIEAARLQIAQWTAPSPAVPPPPPPLSTADTGAVEP